MPNASAVSQVATPTPNPARINRPRRRTCKVNETAAIDREEVREAFNKAGVRVLVGDWTNGDPAITRFLEDRGRAGVPLYLWYQPGKAPEELPQILTPSMLTSRARRAP